MSLINRCLKAIDNRLFHKDKVFRFDDSLIYEREDGVIFFVCGVSNSTDEAFIFRLEGDDLDVWLHTCTYQEALCYFQSIKDEFEYFPDEGPGRDQGEKPKSKSEQLSTLEKINKSEFGKFRHTLIDESTITRAEMIDETTGKKLYLFIEGDEVRDTLENCASSVSVAELIDTVIHLLNKTDLLDGGRYYYEEGPFTNWEKMRSTERICSVYDLFLKSSKKRECLELIASSFFQAMLDDVESCESRESLDYLLRRLSK